MENGRSWALGSYYTKTETTEICKYCLALEREMGEWKIWATGVSLSGFSKWLPLGVKPSLKCEIITTIYLLMKNWRWLCLIVFVNRVIQLFFSSRNHYVNQFYLPKELSSFVFIFSAMIFEQWDSCTLKLKLLLLGISNTSTWRCV